VAALEGFLEGGWPSARRLLYGLDDHVPLMSAARGGSTQPVSLRHMARLSWSLCGGAPSSARVARRRGVGRRSASRLDQTKGLSGQPTGVQSKLLIDCPTRKLTRPQRLVDFDASHTGGPATAAADEVGER
jgi:hypothetical protein